MLLGLHPHNARPEERHGFEWNWRPSVLRGNPQCFGFAFCRGQLAQIDEWQRQVHIPMNDLFAFWRETGSPDLMASKNFIEALLENSEVATAKSNDSERLIVDRHVGLLG